MMYNLEHSVGMCLFLRESFLVRFYLGEPKHKLDTRCKPLGRFLIFKVALTTSYTLNNERVFFGKHLVLCLTKHIFLLLRTYLILHQIYNYKNNIIKLKLDLGNTIHSALFSVKR